MDRLARTRGWWLLIVVCVVAVTLAFGVQSGVCTASMPAICMTGPSIGYPSAGAVALGALALAVLAVRRILAARRR